ncbi:MAG: DEAD/DEAH box helicase, partial [Propionibacteriaceae bacterium]|nr:DEAD/DEAH box helicase [Propionibacteriaceae bacterium]
MTTISHADHVVPAFDGEPIFYGEYGIEDPLEQPEAEERPKERKKKRKAERAFENGIPALANDGPTFADLGLPDTLLHMVEDLGFTAPTEIQTATIPDLLAGRDIVGIAQTGTGKTAAFGLPMLAAIDPGIPETQGLVLAPTRELAMQVAAALESFAQTLPGHLRVTAVYGGAPFYMQKKALQAGSHIVVGTPGRIIDHLEHKTLDLSTVRFLVLDEADEMLRMGFAEDVDTILAKAPQHRQTALFSATMPAGIRRTAIEHLNNPVQVSLTPKAPTVENVTQRYAVVPNKHKIGALARLLAVSDAAAAIVFTHTRVCAEEVGLALVERGVNAATISGNVSQPERERIVERLRNGQIDVLVATDVAARGLDVERVGLVVNFDIPREAESYVHRVGRTARAGRTGEAFAFVTPSERGKLRNIEKAIRKELIESPVPTPAQVTAHKVAALMGRVPGRLEAGRLDLAREAVTALLDSAEIDPIDLATVLAAIAVGDFGPTSAKGRKAAAAEDDLDSELKRLVGSATSDGRGSRNSGGHGRDHGRNFDSDRRGSWDRDERGGRFDRNDRRSGGRGSGGSGNRYWIGVGHAHGIKPGAIVGAIANEGNLRGKDLGRIEMFGNFSLVEIAPRLSKDTLRRLAKTRVAGRALGLRPDL